MSSSELISGIPLLSDLLDLRGTAGFGNAVFYSLIAKYLDNEIVTTFNELLSRSFALVSAAIGVVLAIWIWLQGWRIMSGQSRDSMAQFFSMAAQRVFIVAVAFSASMGSAGAFHWLANDLPLGVNYLVTGENKSPIKGIDENLAFMQVAMASIDVLQTGGDPAAEDAKTRSMFVAAAGTAGPAVVGGAMLLLNKIALGLFVGFGPLFVLALIFDVTKPLFQKWLYYGLATIFSLVMLNLMIGIATEMVVRVAGALWVSNFATSLIGGGSEGISSRALQQGGLGLILTTLIVTTPPMAGAFFNGVMGQFSAFSAFGGAAPNARGPGSPPTALAGGARDYGAQAGQERPMLAGGSADPRNFGIGQQATGGQNDRGPFQSPGERGVANNPAPELLRAPAPASMPPPPGPVQPIAAAPPPVPPLPTQPRGGPGYSG